MINLLLIGATGTVGSAVLDKVKKDKNINVTLFLRDLNKCKVDSDVKVVQGDLSDMHSIRKALTGIDMVFLNSNSSPDMVKLQCNMLEACADADIKRVVRISVVGASHNRTFIPGFSDWILSRWHSQIEQYGEKLGVNLVHIRPEFFMQNFNNFLDSIRSDGLFYGAAGQGKIPPVDVRDIAKVVNAILVMDNPKKEYIITGGETLSFYEMAEKISNSCDRKIKYIDLEPEQLKKSAIESGKPEWLAQIMFEIFSTYRQGFSDQVREDFQDILGEKQMLFSEFSKTLDVK